jgi:hypothetical protein
MANSKNNPNRFLNPILSADVLDSLSESTEQLIKIKDSLIDNGSSFYILIDSELSKLIKQSIDLMLYIIRLP